MKEIKTLRATGASGKHLEAEKEYKVPDEVSQSDANILVKMKKAEWVEPGPEPEKEETPEQKSKPKTKKGK